MSLIEIYQAEAQKERTEILDQKEDYFLQIV